MKEIIAKTYEFEVGDLVWVKRTAQLAVFSKYVLIDNVEHLMIRYYFNKGTSSHEFWIREDEVTYVKSFEDAYVLLDRERGHLIYKLEKEAVNQQDIIKLFIKL